MRSLINEINVLKNAVYGKDVRGSLVNALTVISNSQNSLEDNLKNAISKGFSFDDELKQDIYGVNVMNPPTGYTACVGDGTTNDTENFKTLIQAFNDIYIPANVNLYVTSAISLNSNTHIRGNGIITIGGNAMVPFNADEIENILIEGLKIVGNGTERTNKYLLMARKSTNIKILNTTLINCGAIATLDPIDNGGYNSITSEDDLTSDIYIDGNTMINDFDTYNTSIGVLLQYVKNATITDNHIYNYLHGIQFWGGDANPSTGNGNPSNQKWCKNITIADNIVFNSDQGGIWGSMGENVKVDNNYVEVCGDVGIDFECCKYATATDNTVIDCKFANLACFHYCEEVSFKNNTVICTGKTIKDEICKTLFKSWNDTLVGKVTTIILEGNTFYYNNYTDDNLGLIKGDPVYFMDIINNTFRNVVINYNSGYSNMGGRIIKGNKFLIDKVLTDNTDCIINIYKTNTIVEDGIIEDGGCIVEGNLIKSRYSLVNNTAIKVMQDDYNVSLVSIIKDNTVLNFSKSLHVVGGTSESGINPKFVICGNVLSGSYVNGSDGATIVKFNNKDLQGNDI